MKTKRWNGREILIRYLCKVFFIWNPSDLSSIRQCLQACHSFPNLPIFLYLLSLLEEFIRTQFVKWIPESRRSGWVPPALRPKPDLRPAVRGRPDRPPDGNESESRSGFLMEIVPVRVQISWHSPPPTGKFLCATKNLTCDLSLSV